MSFAIETASDILPTALPTSVNAPKRYLMKRLTSLRLVSNDLVTSYGFINLGFVLSRDWTRVAWLRSNPTTLRLSHSAFASLANKVTRASLWSRQWWIENWMQSPRWCWDWFQAGWPWSRWIQSQFQSPRAVRTPGVGTERGQSRCQSDPSRYHILFWSLSLWSWPWSVRWWQCQEVPGTKRWLKTWEEHNPNYKV